MSNANLARRTAVDVAFAGVNITQSMKPYLLSLTYTDNEEDESDDLQIKLQDREGLWLCRWLNDMVQAAAASSGTVTTKSVSEAATSYRVTASIGLNVRSGPGTGYSKLGTLAYGATVSVSSIADGWAAIQYSGQTAYVSATYLEQAGSASTGGAAEASTTSGLKIRAGIVRENWNGEGTDKVLDCGQFELDTIDASGPPATVTIKATALPFDGQIRQTKRSQAWESYTLLGIAREMAARNGLACLFESADDPYYDRVEQVQSSDIAFLSTLCHNAGVSLKATSNILVLFDQSSYEAKSPIKTISRGCGYTKYKLSVGKSDTQYALAASPTLLMADALRRLPTLRITRNPKRISSSKLRPEFPAWPRRKLWRKSNSGCTTNMPERAALPSPATPTCLPGLRCCSTVGAHLMASTSSSSQSTA